MEAASQELMDLKLKTGKALVQDGRRMSVVALAFTLKGVVMMAEWIFGSDLCRRVQIFSLWCVDL